ncbi:unnamed protein product [Closterium sp. NIES-65]|nr:unnamed protein product [Closterium sp. NIES-65]
MASRVSQVDAVKPVEVAVDSGAARGAEPGGAEPGGAESGGAEPGGVEPGGAEPGGPEPGGTETGGAEPGGAEPGGAGSARVASGGACRAAGARGATVAADPGVGTGVTGATGPGGARTGGTGAAGNGGAAGAVGAGAAGGTGGTRATGPGDAPGAGAAGGTRAGGPAGVGVARAGAAGGAGAGGAAGAGASEGAGVSALGAGGAAGAGAAGGGTCAVPANSGGDARPRPYFVPLLEQPASRPASPVRAARTSSRAPRPRPPAVPGTYQMALCPSTAPLRVPLPSPPESSLPVLADPESDSLRAASPTVTHLLATVITDPSFESTAASALVAKLVNFAARCRLDYAASLVAESESVCPPSIRGECAPSMDVLEDRREEFQCFAAALSHLVSTLIASDIPTPRSYAEAIEGPYSSQWQTAMDAEMASWKSTGTYVDEVPPPGRTSLVACGFSG